MIMDPLLKSDQHPNVTTCRGLLLAHFYHVWSIPINDVSHCRILSPDKTEWRLISATLWMRMNTLFRGWPVMVNDTHTRRRRTRLWAILRTSGHTDTPTHPHTHTHTLVITLPVSPLYRGGTGKNSLKFNVNGKTYLQYSLEYSCPRTMWQMIGPTVKVSLAFYKLL